MALNDELLALAKQASIVNLLESGVDAAFFNELVEILKLGVIQGSDFSDLADELNLYINGDNTRLGTLDRYIRQITTDSVNQFNRSYIHTLDEAAGNEFFVYSGSTIKDSRAFCVDRSELIFHQLEIEAWPEHVTTGIDDPTATEKNWQGRMPGTNKSTIFEKAGGWQCRHIIVGVQAELVPSDVLERNIKNGNFTP